MNDSTNRILIVGNHTCGNRGDSAILRGLLYYINEQAPHVDCSLVSRMPVSSEFLLGHKFVEDRLYAYHQQSAGMFGQVLQRIKVNLFPLLLIAHIRGFWPFKLPQHIRKHIEFLKSFDAVVHVGGSFFVDLYGKSQYEHALAAMVAGKPVFMLGHSVGPFSGRLYKFIARFVFSRTKQVSVREAISRSLLEELGIDANLIQDGADTAWLLPSSTTEKVKLDVDLKAGPYVAFTARRLSPFDVRLGVKQDVYERAMAELADHLVASGYKVLLCSSCTGIDGYNRDDRMVALSIQKLMSEPNRAHVIMSEVNDLGLAKILSQCELTVGTRLHSAIISMNAGTPALALNYEHKSKGILTQANLSSCAIELRELVSGKLKQRILHYLQDSDLKEQSNKGVALEREKAAKMIDLFLEKL